MRLNPQSINQIGVCENHSFLYLLKHCISFLADNPADRHHQDGRPGSCIAQNESLPRLTRQLRVPQSRILSRSSCSVLKTWSVIFVQFRTYDQSPEAVNQTA